MRCIQLIFVSLGLLILVAASRANAGETIRNARVTTTSKLLPASWEKQSQKSVIDWSNDTGAEVADLDDFDGAPKCTEQYVHFSPSTLHHPITAQRDIWLRDRRMTTLVGTVTLLI